MKEIIFSILAGSFIGFIFKFMKLPLPAPPVLSGIAGILGVYLGGKLFEVVLKALKV